MNRELQEALERFKRVVDSEPSKQEMLRTVNEIEKFRDTNRPSSGSRFNIDFFDTMVQASLGLVEMYRALGKDFKSDLRREENTVLALQSISKWFKEYNLRDFTEITEITKVTMLAQVKVMVDSLVLIESGYTLNKDYALISGVFTPIETYVVPLKSVGYPNINQTDSKAVLNALKRLAVHMERRDVYGPILPLNAVIGTMKLVGNSHVIMTVRDQDNPFGRGVGSIRQWRYIDSSGLSY